MTKVTIIETQITSEESYPAEPVQQRDDLLVLHSLPTDFMTDLTNPKPPTTQELPLAIRDVLIENVHDPGNSSGT
jgi:hypothetical protein